MISLVQSRVPEVEFRISSLFKAEVLPCQAVASLGECLNYLFDSDNNHRSSIQLFHRIYHALTSGGTSSSTWRNQDSTHLQSQINVQIALAHHPAAAVARQ
jgi:hypothetical protein